MLKKGLTTLPVIISFNLASSVDTTTVVEYKSLVQERFPKVFKWFKKPWRLTLIIKLTQDVVPHTIYTKNSGFTHET